MGQTETKWCVFTGGPSSGKTTVLTALADMGIHVVPETARRYIQSQLEQGTPLTQLRQDPLKFQTGLLAAKMEVEQQLSPTQRFFLDRALPDSIAYFELYGLESGPVIPTCSQFRYDRVFFFDSLALEDDNLRVENEETAAFLSTRLMEVYQTLGYASIRVPVFSVEQRVRFILDRLD